MVETQLAWSIVALENTYQKGTLGLHGTLRGLIRQMPSRTLEPVQRGSQADKREQNRNVNYNKVDVSC